MSAEAFFVVRAVVADAAMRARFDAWYSGHHLPLALQAFKIGRAWRFWSTSDPAVHYAVYRFSNTQAMNERLQSDAFRALVADFDAAWPTGVTRSREMLSLAEAADA